MSQSRNATIVGPGLALLLALADRHGADLGQVVEDRLAGNDDADAPLRGRDAAVVDELFQALRREAHRAHRLVARAQDFVGHSASIIVKRAPAPNPRLWPRR